MTASRNLDPRQRTVEIQFYTFFETVPNSRPTVGVPNGEKDKTSKNKFRFHKQSARLTRSNYVCAHTGF